MQQEREPLPKLRCLNFPDYAASTASGKFKCVCDNCQEYRLALRRRHQTVGTPEYEKGKAARRRCAMTWQKNNPDKVWAGHLRRKYGMTLEEYHERFRRNDGRCQICKCLVETKVSVHVDHDHDTGKVRGLLCVNCNLMLGYAKDKPNVLEEAAAYLRRHESETAMAEPLMTSIASVYQQSLTKQKVSFA